MDVTAVRAAVEQAGGRATMTVRELRDMCGCARLTARARARIDEALRAAGLACEPALADLPLSVRVTVVDRRRSPAPPPDVLRVAPWLAEPEPVSPRRLAPRRSALLGGVLGGLIVALVAVVLGTGGGGGGPEAPSPGVAGAAPAGVAVTPVARAATTAADVGREARYQAAAAMGRRGRYLAARREMLALVPYRRSRAAARAFGVRAAQGMLAEARRIHARQPARARRLVRDAARIAPGLSSLPRVRALVARRR